MDVLVSCDTRPYCVTVTLDDWQRRMTRLVAREIRRYRDERKISAQQLADRTAELGMEIPRSVLANLESGRRDTVAVPELLVLAAALQVAPIELLCPVGFDEQIEILPGRLMDPLSASRWIDGELMLDVSDQSATLRPPDEGEESSTKLLEQHAGYLDEIQVNDSEVGRVARDLDAVTAAIHLSEAAAADAEKADRDPAAAARLRSEADAHRKTRDSVRSELDYRMSAARQYRKAAVSNLRHIRAEMRRRGMLLPALPPSVTLDEGIDASEGDETR
jgi:transcriptional regulator with XRE-family HTH domain